MVEIDLFDRASQDLGGMVMVKRKEGGEKMVKRASCPSGASSLYTFPTASASVDTSAGPVVFTWNSACLDSSITKVDLTLYAPTLAKSVLKVWTGIAASDGSYSTDLLPKWWNSTEKAQLQIALSDSESFSFLSSTPSGPLFEVTYPASKLVTVTGGSTVAAAPADTGIVDPVYTVASILTKGGLNAGSVFAAVFFPIIILLAGIFVYVRWARAKQSKKRERWSKAIDNRMSVISTSWNPASSPDPRKSVSSAANRRTQVGSVYSTYDGRPSQSSSHLRDNQPHQEMSQNSFARPATSVFLATGEQRASRVSFAFVDTPNNRVSFAEGGGPSPKDGSFARGGGRGASQVGSQNPRPSISIYSRDGTKQTARGRDSDDMVSPDQAAGPWVLGAEEVEEELSSMAAVRMMNGSHNPSDSYSSLNATAGPKFPSPAHTLPNITTNNSNNTPSSPEFPNSTPNSAQAFSPDAMLRNYASMGAGGQKAGRRMTVLGKPGENNPFRKSMAGETGDEYGHAR